MTKAETAKHTDDGEEYKARRKERNAAIDAAAAEAYPEQATSSQGGGAKIDTAITELDQTTAKQAGDIADLKTRVAALEAGTPPDPTPPDPTPGKRYPDVNDAMCGLPAGTAVSGSGSLTVSTAGQKISGKKITGRLTISADNVEIFNCLIDTTDWWAIMVNGANANIHHCTIQSSSTAGNSAINTGNGTNVHHCRFRGFENAFNIAGSNNIIEWNDVDQLKGNSDSHYDALQADGGFSNLKIRHNRLDCDYSQTSACMLDNYFGAIKDVEVSDNFLGGGGYPAYLDGSFKGSANATNIAYLNNDMRKGQWGYFYHDSAGTNYTRTGNKDYLTGVNVDSK